MKMRSSVKLAAGIVAAILGASPARTRAQSAASVWDGVYTDEQAGRGEALYRQNCGSCHGDRLQGKHPTPALAGETFRGNWNGETLDDLFEKIQSTMPADKPGKLGRPQNADILAFILKFNEFPAGKDDLPNEAAHLKQIRFEASHPLK